MSADDAGFTDCWIVPPHGPVTRPRANFNAPHTGPVDQSTDNSVGKNDALPWAWTAALFGGLGFGGVIVLCLLKPWETSDRAAQAELRAEFAQRIARTEALAELARKEASTAKDMVDLDRAKSRAREELKR